MSGILTYVLHYQGEFNKNSLGAVTEAGTLAKELGGEAAAVVVGEGDDLTDDLCASLGKYGATKVYRARGPEGLAQPVVDVMATVITVIRICHRRKWMRRRFSSKRAIARSGGDGGARYGMAIPRGIVAATFAAFQLNRRLRPMQPPPRGLAICALIFKPEQTPLTTSAFR